MSDKVLVTAPGVLTDRERLLIRMFGGEVMERERVKPGDMYVVDPDAIRSCGPDGVWRTMRDEMNAAAK